MQIHTEGHDIYRYFSGNEDVCYNCNHLKNDLFIAYDRILMSYRKKRFRKDDSRYSKKWYTWAKVTQICHKKIMHFSLHNFNYYFNCY